MRGLFSPAKLPFRSERGPSLWTYLPAVKSDTEFTPKPPTAERYGLRKPPPLEWYWVMLACSVFLLATLGVLGTGDRSRLSAASCLPGSTRVFGSRGSNIWSFENFFSITLHMGHFTFSEAKAIDVAWDLVVGRGGQMMVAFINYRMFSRVIVHIMEVGSVTPELYATNAFETGPISMTRTLLTDFAKGRYPTDWYSRYAYVVMICMCIYMLVLPTAVSAMTSYGAVSRAVVQYGNELTNVEDWYPAFGVVLDGSRLTINDSSDGLNNRTVSDNYVIPLEGMPEDNSFKFPSFSKDYMWTQEDAQGDSVLDNGVIDFYLKNPKSYLPYEKSMGCPQHNVDFNDYVADVSKFSGRVPNNGNLTFDDYTSLQGPLLNIIVFYDPNVQYPDKCFSSSIKRNDLYPYWINRATNQIIDNTAMAPTCNATFDYQWGFSFLLLFILAVINVILAAAIFVLLAYTRRTGVRDGLPWHLPHMWRAIADLSQILHERCGNEPYKWTTDDLQKAMKGKKMKISKREAQELELEVLEPSESLDGYSSKAEMDRDDDQSVTSSLTPLAPDIRSSTI